MLKIVITLAVITFASAQVDRLREIETAALRRIDAAESATIREFDELYNHADHLDKRLQKEAEDYESTIEYDIEYFTARAHRGLSIADPPRACLNEFDDSIKDQVRQDLPNILRCLATTRNRARDILTKIEKAKNTLRTEINNVRNRIRDCDIDRYATCVELRESHAYAVVKEAQGPLVNYKADLIRLDEEVDTVFHPPRTGCTVYYNSEDFDIKFLDFRKKIDKCIENDHPFWRQLVGIP